jgi:dynein heavy chain
LVTGDTGTGKSISVNQKLLHGLDSSAFQNILINYSAQTSANQVQDTIDAKLDKRRSKVYGPPLGKKVILFVDDLNMPAKETYGAQPPIEILRQLLDHGGWFDRKLNEWHHLVDIQLISAMGPPGGGRTRITQRIVRHFNVLNFVPFDETSLQGIFGLIMDWFLQRYGAGFFFKGRRYLQFYVQFCFLLCL